ncbi:MAG: hypothetical protein MI923_07955 [Phycisphaerales bacterium]|nr:hypothetical protein [Phycisphaerales bacterium]
MEIRLRPDHRLKQSQPAPTTPFSGLYEQALPLSSAELAARSLTTILSKYSRDD